MSTAIDALERSKLPMPVAGGETSPTGALDARFKVAYLVNQYPKVSHTFIRREIRALERRGLHVQRFAIRGWADACADPADAEERAQTTYVLKEGVLGLAGGVGSYLYKEPRRFLTALRAALRLSWNADRPLPLHIMYLVQACCIARSMSAEGVTHIHAHFGTNPAEVALLVHLLTGASYSFTVHGPDEFDRGVYLHLDEKIGRSKFIVAVNSYCRSQMFRRTAYANWPRIKVVHCGLEQAFFDAEARPPADIPRFVCVGRLCEQKGQLLLLDAFARVAAKADCRLVLAGDGEMRGEIERRIGDLGLQGKVSITGWISEAQVRDEIQAARALVLPSFAESLPVVIMEAMALKRPVISTYVAGIPELVVPGETGWLVPAGSIAQLAEALDVCLQAPAEILTRMGETAYARVRERHHIDHEAGRLVALFKAADASCESEL